MGLDLRDDKFRAKVVIERTPWFAVVRNNDCFEAKPRNYIIHR